MLQWPGWITSKCLLACWFISFVCYYEIIDCRSGKGYADDYYLDSKSQCAGKRGACPDRYVWIGFNLQWWWVLKHLQSGNLKNCTNWTMFCEVVETTKWEPSINLKLKCLISDKSSRVPIMWDFWTLRWSTSSPCWHTDNHSGQKIGDTQINCDKIYTLKTILCYRYDQTIYTNGSQPVIWAVGPINSKVN